MKSEERDEMNEKIRALTCVYEDAFVNVDIGDFSGLVIVQSKNEDYRKIYSALLLIEDYIQEYIDADVMMSAITITYPKEAQEIRFELFFTHD